MTIEEKCNAIQDYCNKHDYSVSFCECPHEGDENFYCAMYTPQSAPEEVVDEWYATIAKESSEKVNHPAHYQGKHECIDEMVALFGVDAVIGFCKCNVHKYHFRADAKNGQEDRDKADWYMDKLMELEAKS